MHRLGQVMLIITLFSCGRQEKGRFSVKDLSSHNFSDDPAWNKTVKKYGTAFNTYRQLNGLPLLPADFYISNYGGDYVEWTNPSDQYPGFWQKSITWVNDEHSQTIITENNLIQGKNGEILRFFYIRHNSDSVIMNYQSLSESQKTETDSFYLRSYRIYEPGGVKMLSKNQYDSILSRWAVVMP